MLNPGERFENPRTGAAIEILSVPGAEGGAIEVWRVLKPRTGKLLPHVHLDYTEHFWVEQGRARARSGGRKRELGPGDELVVAPGERHLNPYNVSAEDLVMRQSFEPGTEFTLAFVETFSHLTRADRTDRQGEVPLSAIFGVADATGSQSFAAGIPHAFQLGVMAPLGARVARLRGYELRLPR